MFDHSSNFAEWSNSLPFVAPCFDITQLGENEKRCILLVIPTLNMPQLEENQKRFNEQKLEDGQQRQRILAEKDLSQRVHRETLDQLEQDADREIEELKDSYEDRLASERDDKVRLRGQAGIHRKHHDDLKRLMQKKDEEFRFFLEDARKKQEKIDLMIHEREQNMKEIKDRDKTIGTSSTARPYYCCSKSFKFAALLHDQ